MERYLTVVITGLVPVIPIDWAQCFSIGMPGTSPGMTSMDFACLPQSLWRLICGRKIASRPMAGRKAQT